jgi:hypothetical protein
MKNYNHNFKNALFLCGIVSLFSACVSSVPLSVLQPAMMKIPDHITTIAVIDRSKPSKGWLNALEGAVTGESIGQDREGRLKAVQGLTDALSKTPRFNVKSTGIEMIGSETGSSMLPPLDWYEIEGLCKKYGSEALAVIEMFDTDLNVRTNRREVKTKTKDKRDSIYIEFDAERRLDVKLGWRLYDPQNKIILDEVVTTRGGDSKGTGVNEQKAKNNLPPIYRVVEDISFGAGLDYGARIAPTWVTFQRNYFGNAKGVYAEQMQKAARYAQTSDWIKAAEIWQSVAIQKTDIKAAGKAVFNMAVANECLGKLDIALDWANKAYGEYGVKNAKSYIETLKMRQNDERKVQQQLVKPKEKV